jgi:hypothetical protein
MYSFMFLCSETLHDSIISGPSHSVSCCTFLVLRILWDFCWCLPIWILLYDYIKKPCTSKILYDLTSGFFHLERARHIEILHTGIKRYNKFAFHSYITVYGGLRSESLLLFKITCDEFLQVFVIRAFKLRIFRLFKLTRVEQTLVIIDSFRKRLRSTVHAFTDWKKNVYL